MKTLGVFLLILLPSITFGQGHGFEYGIISPAEFDISNKTDTAVSAVILNEFGEVSFDTEQFDLVFEYHVRIKILNKEGSKFADFEIPLRKDESWKEEVLVVQASTYNLAGRSIAQDKLETRSVFTEDYKYVTLKKFTLSNVQVGSIIEIKYSLKSPFIFNLRTWEFQSELPKMHSEFWAKIPANYTYNIVLKGFLRLGMNKAERVAECVVFGTAKADCSLFKYAMDNVPPFIEEDYMTAKSNFLSAIYFELAEVKHFDGRTNQYTEKWSDVVDKLLKNSEFGGQLKKGRREVDKLFTTELSAEPDLLKRATFIYDVVKNYFTWNEQLGKYTEDGIKKAIELRKGNAAEINLSLIAALQNSGLEANPLIISTRDNGLPHDLHPVLSDFNYVIVHLQIEGKTYLLDATEPLFPFGILPLRCINGRGRLIVKESKWVELTSAGKMKKHVALNVELDSSGNLTGELVLNHYEYSAALQRSKFNSSASQEAYVKELDSKWANLNITSYEVENLKDIYSPLVEKIRVEFTQNDDGASTGTYYISPFQMGTLARNPFKSIERLYPVDFGAPIEESYSFVLNFPETFVIDELPESDAFSLGGNGGKYLLNVARIGNVINISNNYTLNKTVYDAREYQGLKEFFNRAVQSHQALIVLKKM